MKTFREMETVFYADVRSELLDGLALCTNGQQRKFKRVHADGNLELSIEQVVIGMPRDQLDWAMRVVRRAVESG